VAGVCRVQRGVSLCPQPSAPALARSFCICAFFCAPTTLGGAEPTGSCTTPGVRRWPDGQPYGWFRGPAQAAVPQRARGKNVYGLAPHPVEK